MYSLNSVSCFPLPGLSIFIFWDHHLDSQWNVFYGMELSPPCPTPNLENQASVLYPLEAGQVLILVAFYDMNRLQWSYSHSLVTTQCLFLILSFRIHSFPVLVMQSSNKLAMWHVRNSWSHYFLSWHLQPSLVYKQLKLFFSLGVLSFFLYRFSYVYIVTAFISKNLSLLYFIKFHSHILKPVKFSFGIYRVEETVASYISVSGAYHWFDSTECFTGLGPTTS